MTSNHKFVCKVYRITVNIMEEGVCLFRPDPLVVEEIAKR
jgi:hypothetical protein